MIGVIAADLIASPYKNNPRENTSDIFFPLFEPSDKIELDPSRGRAKVRTFEPRMGVMSSLAAAAADWYVNGHARSQRWEEFADKHLGSMHPAGLEVLAVCGPMVELSEDREEALANIQFLMSELKPHGDVAANAIVFGDLLASVDGKTVRSEVKDRFTEAGFVVGAGPSEVRPFLNGLFVRVENGNKLAPGDGKPSVSAEDVFAAVYAAYSESGSYEECVRRAVGMGGDCVLTAVLAGTLAERVWPVPDVVRNGCDKFFNGEDRALLNRVEKVSDARKYNIPIDFDHEDLTLSINGEAVRVVSMEGFSTVYGIPEGRQDMEEAAKKIQASLGGQAVIVRPEEIDGVLESLQVQRDRWHRPLSGLYFEHGRPEVRTLWFQEGTFRSSVTRQGLSSKGFVLGTNRSRTWNEFLKLKDHANGIRTELERYAGFDSPVLQCAEHVKQSFNVFIDTLEQKKPEVFGATAKEKKAVDSMISKLSVLIKNPGERVMDFVVAFKGTLSSCEGFAGFNRKLEELGKKYAAEEGLHLHFTSAFYPVVYHDHVELRQGDVLRGRVGIDSDGRFYVDTNAKTGLQTGEYLEGALNTMNIFTKVDDMKSVFMKLDQYCLGFGHIEDEEEQKALQEGDSNEIESIRMKYKMNTDRVIEDLKEEPDRASLTVRLPDGRSVSRSEKSRTEAEQRRRDSVVRYEGKSLDDIKYSEAYKGSVFTIGHSNMKLEEMNSLLKRFGIDFVVDIRSVPYSKYNSHFNSNVFEQNLSKMNIDYQNVPEFGGSQHLGGNADARLLTYDEIFHTEGFRNKMDSLLKVVDEGARIALMCSESDPMDCHRMLMMGRALAHPEVYGSNAEPVDVEHITRQGYVLSQQFFENKLLEHAGLVDRSLDTKGMASVKSSGLSSSEMSAIIEDVSKSYEKYLDPGTPDTEKSDIYQRLASTGLYEKFMRGSEPVSVAEASKMIAEFAAKQLQASGGDSLVTTPEHKQGPKVPTPEDIGKAYAKRSAEVLKKASYKHASRKTAKRYTVSDNYGRKSNGRRR